MLKSEGRKKSGRFYQWGSVNENGTRQINKRKTNRNALTYASLMYTWKSSLSYELEGMVRTWAYIAFKIKQRKRHLGLQEKVW